MGWTLEHSDTRYGPRLVLLSLANHAHADGTNSWPSQETIAREANLTMRQVRRCLRELETAGAITRVGMDPVAGKCVNWTINMRSQMSAPDANVRGHLRPPRRTPTTEKRSQMSAKPLRNRPGTVRPPNPQGGQGQSGLKTGDRQRDVQARRAWLRKHAPSADQGVADEWLEQGIHDGVELAELPAYVIVGARRGSPFLVKLGS